MSAQAQTYTTNEAIAIAQKLRELKILSAKGEQVLLARIRNTRTPSAFDEKTPGPYQRREVGGRGTF